VCLSVLMLGSSCRAPQGSEEGNGTLSQSLVAQPTFDWSVPDRLKLSETDGVSWTSSPYVDRDQLFHRIDEVSPRKFRVDFDACANPKDAARYQWRIEGERNLIERTDCRFSYEFRSEGIFQVSLTVADAQGMTSSVTRDVTVQDWLVVGLGDSYGSGEGNPDVPIPPSAIEEWTKANTEFAQAQLDLAGASRILRIIQEVSGPMDYLRDKIHEEAEAIIDLPFQCAKVWNPLACPDAHGHLFAATRRVVTAGGELVIALAPRALELGLELTLDPRELWKKAIQIKNVAQTTWNLANEVVIKNTPTKLLVDIFDGSKGAKWQDRQCHRSHFSSQAQAALALEQSDPKTSVTFINLACSGATITEGLLGVYIGQESAGFYPLSPQVEAARELASGQEVDAVLLSIGGNDVGFGQIIPACISEEPCDAEGSPERGLGESTLATALCAGVSLFNDGCINFFRSADAAGQSTARKILETNRPKLALQYDSLAKRLGASFPAVSREQRRVYITEYPDSSQTENGGLCSFRIDRADPFLNLPGMSAREWGWAATSLTRNGLNQEIGAAARANSWTYVGGIFGDYAKHGYCSDENWFVRIQDSFLRQGNQSGTLHPNVNGQLATARRIGEAINVDLYAANAGNPRIPQVPPLADAGIVFATDEGTVVPLSNSSMDPSRSGAVAYSWQLELTRAGAAALSAVSVQQPNLIAKDDTGGVAYLTVINPYGATTANVGFVVRNVPPTVNLGPDRNAQFGSNISFNATFTDPGVLDTHTASVDWGDGIVEQLVAANGRVSLGHAFRKLGLTTVKLSVRDDDGGEGVGTMLVNVVNTPPKLLPIIGPSDQVEAGEVVSLSASVLDVGDTSVGFWIWDDGETTAATTRSELFGSTASGTHAYAGPGVYSVVLVVFDSAGASASAEFLFVIVVDHAAGSFQAKGQVFSPPGNLFGLEPSLSGELDVAVRARYVGDKVTPSGRVNFKRGPKLLFKSTFLEWLVVKGNKAQIYGFGSLNGVPEYDFYAQGIDAGTSGGADGFRMKIWESGSGRVVYDNAQGQSDDLDRVAMPRILSGDVVITKP